MPPEARWTHLKAEARQAVIGRLVDDAMAGIERDNPGLKDVLPKDYARPALDKERLGQLIDMVSNVRVGDEDARSRDVLGRVYEYFLSQFASAEGKKGGEFYTPRCVVKLLVEMLEPYQGRVYDPCCGSSGMFVQSVEFIQAHATGNGNARPIPRSGSGKVLQGVKPDISIYGQESNYTTWRLVKMNLAIRGIEGQIAHGDSFHNDRHPDLKADFILANPPFNVSDWGGDRLADAFHICLPPPSEQDAIGHILQTLDDKIEMNRRMDETLEVMARALYKSWFVDFDPVRAKMEGHDPELPKDISDLFPDQLVPSDHGQIPQGWRNGRIHDVASLNPESWSAKHQPADLAYVDLTNAKWGYIERVDTFRWGDAPSRARRVLRKGDTIIATVRPGNGSFALIDEDGLTGSTGFAVLRPRRAVDREFVWCACTALENIDRLALLADGGAYPAIRPEEVISTPVVLGDIATRVAFSRLAGSLLDKIETNKRESRCLAVLRETLLPKLISGKVRLKPAENSAGKIA